MKHWQIQLYNEKKWNLSTHELKVEITRYRDYSTSNHAADL